MTAHGRHAEVTWLDDQLTALLVALRRHIQEAPPGTWDDQTLRAAKTVTAALSARLARSGDGEGSGGAGEWD